MKEKMGALKTKLKEKLVVLKKIPKKVLVLLLIVLAVMVGAIVYVTTNRPYSVLVTGASGEEMSAVSGYLINQGIQDYKIINNDTIMVPSSMEYQLKAGLMMEGYPQTGFSYSTYYDHVGALSTESEKNKNYMIMTQERLGAIIRCMDNVKEAYVTITPGEDRGYVLDSGNVVDATASVMVTMQNTGKLTGKQADAIRNLVSHSVQGLHISQVYISDTLGNPYNGGENTEEGASALKLSMEEDWENKIRTEVMKVLVPFFGEENVRVGVNCVVELRQVTEDRRDVYLPEYAEDGSTDGKGIISSQRDDYYLGRPDGNSAGGIVGSETNSDLPDYVENLAEPDGSEDIISGSSQTDYDHSTSNKQIVTTAAELTDCTVSVSINADQAENVNLNAIREHVARAAGIHGEMDQKTGKELLEDKISVMSFDFYQAPTILPPVDDNGTIPLWVYLAAGAGLLGFLLIFLIVFLIRRALKKKKMKKLAAAAQAQAVLQAKAAAEMPADERDKIVQVGADIMNLQSERNMELRQDIREFANTNPEIAAQMVRSWLRGGDSDG